MFHSLYDVGDLIGRGAFSLVYLCRRKETQQIFAVKVINKALCVKKKTLRDEITVLLRVKHANIISLEEVYESDQELLLVMERVTGGELFDRIVRVGVYSERQAAEIVTNVLQALNYLHSCHILHRDIKPENILLASGDSSDVKLSDFGIAKILEDEDDGARSRGRAYTSCGTDYYVAPEVLNGEGYDSKVDLWSLGVVLYIMLCGFPPFSEDENGLESVYLKIRSGVLDFPHPYWTNVSDGAKDLIRNLLNVSPQERFSAAQALNHPWIKGEYSEQPLSSAILEMKRFNQKRRFN
ncbi:CAMK/CAMK1 protein kinase, variant 1 [Phytophthora nicotianae CJ01A1]|nr:CAMK/CAMK1 protein kinase, variant 1 [Phytophthora nicotianae INRA-310]ETI43887.1 CAMK/CAMK1 protein kinase, variant 1 [Phytophthora nicotianae P1569]ETK83937.1 CAMK/CAMK1 protein kinase, variant 1 [Phytophthora nicotianae]ETO72591.1 CAMK/CAMK1 protein kinase, variant 1 [Phytophthora nicotianae P1976]ETP13704.1 CAMK/CAMK1 protein kinase, variant 1 [Phytophthora nicotianae CJ01A1]ETP41766.1 CAMK/CAMK1 protein kinase, variant 1 [Phytophthora nicotianae P10297]